MSNHVNHQPSPSNGGGERDRTDDILRAGRRSPAELHPMSPRLCLVGLGGLEPPTSRYQACALTK